MHIFRGDYFHTEQPSVGSLLWRTTSPTLSFLQLPIGLWVELRPHEHFLYPLMVCSLLSLLDHVWAVMLKRLYWCN